MTAPTNVSNERERVRPLVCVCVVVTLAPTQRHQAFAGLCDDAGTWLHHTGLPAKSGVGDGLIAVSPGKFGIAVVSPPLDDAGNSVRAQRAIAAISNALGGNPLAPTAR
jgi:glutaminase